MKKLENEYRQLMQNEAPDLWSRIEAGVDAKIAESEKIEIKDNSDGDEGNDAWTVVTIENKKRKVINWKKYSLPLVACIAVILCVPMLLTGFFRMAYGGKAESAEMAADCAVADYAAADCAEPEETISVTTDNSAAVVTDEACAEEIDDAYEYVTEDSEEDDYKQSKEAVSESIQILTVIQIAREKDETDNGREKGMVYYLDTEEMGECTLYVPVDAEFVMDMDTHLKIQVEACSEEYDFVFVGIVE